MSEHPIFSEVDPYSMKLHDVIERQISKGSDAYAIITHVPSGWMYQYHNPPLGIKVELFVSCYNKEDFKS